MPPNPFVQILERLAALEATTAELQAKVAVLELCAEHLKANQLKWSPGYRFPMPPLSPLS